MNAALLVPTPITSPLVNPGEVSAPDVASVPVEVAAASPTVTPEELPNDTGDGEIRCICGDGDDDGFTIACDQCNNWQHGLCVGIERGHDPEKYFCTNCRPRNDLNPDEARKRQQERKRLERDKEVARQKKKKSHKKKESVTVVTGQSKPSSLPNGHKAPSPRETPAPKSKPKQSGRNSSALPSAPILLPESDHSGHHTRATSPVRTKLEPKLEINTDNRGYEVEYSKLESNHVEESIRTIIFPPIGTVTTVPPRNRTDFETVPKKFSVRAEDDSTPFQPRYVLYAEHPLSKHELIGEMIGDVSSANSYTVEPRNQYSSLRHPKPYVFFAHVENNTFCIDTRRQGNESRFIRRSCKPNVALKGFLVNNAIRFGLIALQFADSADELTLAWDWVENPDNAWADKVIEAMGECACAERHACEMRRLRSFRSISPSSKSTRSLMPLTNANGVNGHKDRPRVHTQNSTPGSSRKFGSPDRQMHLRIPDHEAPSPDDGSSRKTPNLGSRNFDEYFNVEGQRDLNTTREERKLKQQLELIQRLEREQKAPPEKGNKKRKRDSTTSASSRKAHTSDSEARNSTEEPNHQTEEMQLDHHESRQSPHITGGPKASSEPAQSARASKSLSPSSIAGSVGREVYGERSTPASYSSSLSVRRVYVNASVQTETPQPWFKKTKYVARTPYKRPATLFQRMCMTYEADQRAAKAAVEVTTAKSIASDKDKQLERDVPTESSAAPKTDLPVDMDIDSMPLPMTGVTTEANMTDAPDRPQTPPVKSTMVNGHRDYGLHVQMPPSIFPNASSIPSLNSTHSIQNPTHTMSSSLQHMLPIPPPNAPLPSPSTARKKMSLSDYSRLHKGPAIKDQRTNSIGKGSISELEETRSNSLDSVNAVVSSKEESPSKAADEALKIE